MNKNKITFLLLGTIIFNCNWAMELSIDYNDNLAFDPIIYDLFSMHGNISDVNLLPDNIAQFSNNNAISKNSESSETTHPDCFLKQHKRPLATEEIEAQIKRPKISKDNNLCHEILGKIKEIYNQKRTTLSQRQTEISNLVNEIDLTNQNNIKIIDRTPLEDNYEGKLLHILVELGLKNEIQKLVRYNANTQVTDKYNATPKMYTILNPDCCNLFVFNDGCINKQLSKQYIEENALIGLPSIATYYSLLITIFDKDSVDKAFTRARLEPQYHLKKPIDNRKIEIPREENSNVKTFYGPEDNTLLGFSGEDANRIKKIIEYYKIKI